MGRKKRKVELTGEAEVTGEQSEDVAEAADAATTSTPTITDPAVKDDSNDTAVVANTSSGYAMTSHSGEIIQEDIYVSDGSADSDDEDETEIVLSNSRMGIMRRGLHHQMAALQQPNRQWTRQVPAEKSGTRGGDTDGTGLSLTTTELTEEEKRQREEEELALLDPAQRAARLLQEKQRREAEAKIEARRIENEDNVMRDPTLFSKRTAFDIRFDQIDDKPWQRGVGTDNLSEFFNYGLSEEDWLEYSEQQLLVRQELIDASRQKRPPDPTIVPIQPRNKEGVANVVTVTSPTPQATAVSDSNKESGGDTDSQISADAPPMAAIGPTAMQQEEAIAPKKKATEDVPVGVGGAWGAGAAPGSLLARLMEEQTGGGSSDVHDQASDVPLASNRDSDDNRHHEYYGVSEDHPPVKSERDSYYGRTGDPDEYHRDSSEYQRNDDYDRGHRREQRPPPEVDHYGGGRGGWQPPPPPPPPAQDPYYPPPPLGGGGYYGGRGGRGRGYGGRGGGGRGGRGYYERDGGGGDYYQDSQSGWKRPREGGDQWRRR